MPRTRTTPRACCCLAITLGWTIAQKLYPAPSRQSTCEMTGSLSMQFAPTPTSRRGSETGGYTPDPIVRLPMTPPNTYVSSETDTKECLQIALHTMRTERDALDHLQELYATHEVAQRGLAQAVDAIISSQNRSGKLVVSGVGKSAVVARKAVATLTSMNIQCRFLDPLAALHGDLGMIAEVGRILKMTRNFLIKCGRMTP